MKTVGAFWSSEEHYGYPSGDPEDILSSDGSEVTETSPPCGASLWLGVEEGFDSGGRAQNANLKCDMP